MRTAIATCLLVSLSACSASGSSGSSGSQYSTTQEISDKISGAISGAECEPESSGFGGGRDIRCHSSDGQGVNIILYSDSSTARKAAEDSKSVGALFGYGEPHVGGNWILLYRADSESFAKKIESAL